MPVPHMIICECPGNCRCVKSFFDMRIVNDVFVIIIIDEVIILQLPEGNESGNGQEKADEDNLIFLRGHDNSLVETLLLVTGV